MVWILGQQVQKDVKSKRQGQNLSLNEHMQMVEETAWRNNSALLCLKNPHKPQNLYMGQYSRPKRGKKSIKISQSVPNCVNLAPWFSPKKRLACREHLQLKDGKRCSTLNCVYLKPW